ncbi:MAG: hypothetical protein ACRDND_12140 [Streptosporangiaceae bacterium]
MFWSSSGARLLAAAAGPAFGAGLITAVVKLAKIRARRVKHVAVSGADLYRNGVPLTEAQFREAWAALHAEPDEPGPQAGRNEWQLKQGFAAMNRAGPSLVTARGERFRGTAVVCSPESPPATGCRIASLPR